MASYTVESTAGTAAISVVRIGNLHANISVNYATSNGSAIAGRNYVAASGTLTFPAGQVAETFNITILPNSNQAETTTIVNLALSQPTGGATLGSISTATLAITEIPTPPPPPPSPLNTPTITSEQLFTNGRAITAIAFTFNRTLNTSRARSGQLRLLRDLRDG